MFMCRLAPCRSMPSTVSNNFMSSTFFNTDFSASNMHMMELSDSIATGSLFYEANMNGMQARMLPRGPCL